VRDLLPICPRVFRGSIGADDTGDGLNDELAVCLEIIGWTSCIETVPEVLIVLCEQGVNHREADTVDRTPSPGVGGERRESPDADAAVMACVREQYSIGHFQHDRVHVMPGKQVFRLSRIPLDRSTVVPSWNAWPIACSTSGSIQKGVAGSASPDPQAGSGGDSLTGSAPRDDRTGRIWIRSLGAPGRVRRK
jgi:hypothetical protein